MVKTDVKTYRKATYDIDEMLLIAGLLDRSQKK